MRKEIIFFIITLIIGIGIVLLNVMNVWNWNLFSDDGNNILVTNKEEIDNQDKLNIQDETKETDIENDINKNDNTEIHEIDNSGESNINNGNKNILVNNNKKIDNTDNINNEYVETQIDNDSAEDEETQIDNDSAEDVEAQIDNDSAEDEETQIDNDSLLKVKQENEYSTNDTITQNDNVSNISDYNEQNNHNFKDTTHNILEDQWNTLITNRNNKAIFKNNNELSQFNPCIINKPTENNLSSLSVFLDVDIEEIEKVMISPDKKIFVIKIKKDLLKTIECNSSNVFTYNINYPFDIIDVKSNREIILRFKKIKTFPEILIISHLNRSYNLNFISRSIIIFSIKITDYGKILNIEAIG